MSHRITALWTVPRSVSTSFERMMIERGDHTVFDKPFSRSYYYGPKRRSDRFTDSELLDIRSFARRWPDFTDEEAGWDALGRADVGESLGEPLVVVDAAELCSDPGGVVAAWCAAMDLPFLERSLTWEQALGTLGATGRPSASAVGAF